MSGEIYFSGHQPNFLPYMGVFYKMSKSDFFVLDDDVQYSSDGMHNTNFIRANGQKTRITVPVHFVFGTPINKVPICYDRNWDDKMLKTMRMAYGKAAHFDEGYSLLNEHIRKRYEYLSDLNISLIRDIVSRFGIKCELVIASEMAQTGLKKNLRNLCQCLQLGCNVYYSGIGGKDYNDEPLYNRCGVRIEYSDYQPVRYSQVGHAGFIENLSVIDYIFNEGFKLPEEWKQRF